MRKTLTILILFALWHTCVAQPPQSDTVWQKGRDKVELEDAFWDGLMVYRPKGKVLRPEYPRRIEKDLYVDEGGFYEIESVQNAAFFRRTLFSWIPVCESSLPVESVMTLLTGHTGKKKYTVHLLQHRYKFGSAVTDVPLDLLLEYCMEKGCIPYVGIESQETDSIFAMLFMVNVDSGYCHSFRFAFAPAILDQETGEIQAEAYTYTPIHNLKLR